MGIGIGIYFDGATASKWARSEARKAPLTISIA